MKVNKLFVGLGLVTMLALVAGIAFVSFVLSGGMRRSYPVTVTFDRAGQLLETGGDVKLRGVLVGRIGEIEADEAGNAVIQLEMDPAHRVPNNVGAAIRGKTLFGEKFVELRDSLEAPTGNLQAGDQIPIERTLAAFELEEVMEQLLPVLMAIEPGDLGAAFSALAEGVKGQEDAARRAIDNSLLALRNLNSNQDSLDRVLGGLDEGADALARSAPSLASALNDFDSFNRVVLANRNDASASLRNAPTWLDEFGQIMESKYGDLVDISVKGVDVLDLVTGHRESLPFIVTSLKNFTQSWVTNMSVGCTNGITGETVASTHPSLAGSTCWQVWNLSGEPVKSPGGYNAFTKPRPNSATAAAAYDAQLKVLLTVPFGQDVSDLTSLVYAPIRDDDGLIPEDLL